MYYSLLKIGIFHCHVCSPECRYLILKTGGFSSPDGCKNYSVVSRHTAVDPNPPRFPCRTLGLGAVGPKIAKFG